MLIARRTVGVANFYGRQQVVLAACKLLDAVNSEFQMQSPTKCRALILLLLVLTFFWCQAEATGGVPVVGDVRLLHLVRDAQITNATQFQRGEMRCTIQERRIGLKINTTIVWDAGKAFWDYELSEPAPKVSGRKRIEARRTEKGRFIDDGKVRSFYFPENRFAQIISNGNQGYREQFKVRPDDLWFKMEGIHLWSKFLDPDSSTANFSLAVRQEGVDRVVIERRNERNDVLTVVASLAHNGNIIEYESTPHSGNLSLPENERSFWRWGSYHWAKDARGIWYLKHHEYKRSSTGSPKELHFDFVLDVESFNPDPVIAADRFQAVSLKLPHGTTVEEVGPNPKTYRIGDRAAVSQDVLDSLSDSLRRKAFMRPTRQ